MSRRGFLTTYRFGLFRVDPVRRTLLQGNDPVALPPKAFDTLLALVESAGEVIDKDDLIRRVWADSFVEENNLTQYVSLLRRVLGEARQDHTFIVTVPGRGYRFVAPITIDANEDGTGDPHAARDEDQRATRPMVSPAGVAAAHAGRRMLSWPSVVIATLLVAIAAGTFWAVQWSRTRASAADSLIHRVAVLPFSVLGEANALNHLGLGLADALITRLASLDAVVVLPTSSIRRYSDIRSDSATAGRELKVDAVVEGTIHQAGDRIRITVQLVNVRQGVSVWSRTFDEQAGHILPIQDAISAAVAAVLVSNVSGDQRHRLAKRDTHSAAAYDAYLKGRYFWNKRSPETIKAFTYFNRAIELDPGFALAYAGLSDFYLSASTGWEQHVKAVAAARKAIELDDRLVEAHTALAHASMHNLDWDVARDEFARARGLDPNYPPARYFYAEYLLVRGRFDDAVAELDAALTRDPTSVIVSNSLGLALYCSRKNDDAIDRYRKTLELDPGFYWARIRLAQALVQGQSYASAIGELETARASSSYAQFSLAYAHATVGRRAEALRFLDTLRSDAQLTSAAYDIAVVHGALGNRDDAFHWLNVAFAQRVYALVYVNVDPRLDSIRSDSRYPDLLRRVGLGK